MVPLYFYPFTVVLLDDDIHFLNDMEAGLKNCSVKKFNCARSALKFLNYSKDFAPKSIVKSIFESDYEHITFDINIRELHKIVYNKSRHENPVVIVMDYNMPELNGLEFCSKLKQNHCGKILITNYATEMMAIEAFNKGMIDCFIKKTEPDFLSKLRKQIQKLGIEYFKKNSETLLGNALVKALNYTLLKDNKYEEFLQKTLLKYKVAEGYLMDSGGSYLFITQEKEFLGLFIQREEQLDSIVEIGLERNISRELMKSLSNKTKMLCFHSMSVIDLPKKWEHYMFDCYKENIGKGFIYYSIVPYGMDVKYNRIVMNA